ncbi:MAG: hypothetical protein P4M09_08145 [Devosia sp.]|nr:hypothetical protein [Devosia sp.]
MTTVTGERVEGSVRAGDTGTARERAAAAGRFTWPVVFAAFAIIALVLVAKAWLAASTTPLIKDTDDAMRLVTVHDLLGGQGWWDHLQYRLNTPYGAEIHWTHLIDAAIGGIILALRPLAGASADTLTVYIWPLLLLFALLALCARLAFRLAGREAILPAVILPLVSPALLTEFSPGRIDHDSIQILLTLLMMWGAIESIERPRFAWLAGAAAALSLGVGIEGLPSALSALFAIAMIWVVRPERAAALRNFGIPFALGVIALQINQYPPSRWFEPACDEISLVYVAFAVGVGAALTLLSVLPLGRRPAWLRLVVGGALGGVLAVALAKGFPLCLKGPYAALDPWLVDNWLNHIAEAKPIWESVKGIDAFTIGVAVPPFLGLVVIAVRLWRVPEQRGQWLILGLFLAVAVAVMCAEIRGARHAAALALPAAGWLIVTARRRYLSGHRISGVLALLGSWLGFAGLVIAVAVVLVTAPFENPAQAAATSAGTVCFMPEAFAPLARLPAARVMAPVDLGSHVLLFTPHSVVGAPYHRNQAGVRDTFRFFNDPIAAARQILAARGVTLVVVCPGMPELRGQSDAAPDAFVKLFAKGTLPAWLKPVSAPGDVLGVYEVVPG